jgi:3-hydroxyacyl-CoA dehydrogenase / enoyl-CoA hydratase / 3-hydroxybutyryl-CoA epimerase
MMSSSFTTENITADITVLTFDLPAEKVNKFNTAVMMELAERIEILARQTGIRCLLIRSAKRDQFIAGADIKEIVTVTSEEQGYNASRQGQNIFNALSSLPYPTVAVIDGACAGGGTEFALACTYRLASDNPRTRIALPEVNLGLFPGWGGSQRLPRLIGLQRSLDIILTGKNLDSRRAFKAGIVDRIIPKELVMESATKFATEVIAGKNVLSRSRRKAKGLISFLLEKNPLGRKIVFHQAKKMVWQRTHGQYPAPLKAIQSIQSGFKKSLRKGLEIEARLFSQLIGTPISNNLITIYLWTEAIKKENGTGRTDIQIQPLQRAAILGAGVMGGGIAHLFAAKNIPVRVKDINYASVAKAYQQASSILSAKLKRKQLTPLEYKHILGNITGTIDYSGFKQTDLVVEAIVEDLHVKQRVLRELENTVSADTLIVSNTSSLSINEMASALTQPHRFLGMHFFNPVHKMPLVEIIRGQKTADRTVATVFEWTKQLGKTPIVVKDSPGFLINRLLVPYMVEAITLLQEGYPLQQVDRVMVNFGMPMGPIELFDEVGLDVAYKVAGILQQFMGDRMADSDVLAKMVHDNRLGKKNSLGFYRYTGNKKLADPAVGKYISIRNRTGLSAGDMQKRMIYPVINEAARCLQDTVVARPQDVDVGMIFGTGFAPFRGGLLRYADTEGVERIVNTLSGFAATYGSRFNPSAMLLEINRNGKGFYNYFKQT